jgi:hypothetical protein
MYQKRKLMPNKSRHSVLLGQGTLSLNTWNENAYFMRQKKIKWER